VAPNRIKQFVGVVSGTILEDHFDIFDIRVFHDAVLDQGPLPLDVLEEKINAWIATQGRS